MLHELDWASGALCDLGQGTYLSLFSFLLLSKDEYSVPDCEQSGNTCYVHHLPDRIWARN